jgi:hypothetical protein
MQRILIVIVLVLAAAAASDGAAREAPTAQAAHAHHAGPGPAESRPAGGWASDAPLRSGMAGIRRSVDALDHNRDGHMEPEQVLVLVESIEKDVAAIIANCKLDPAADAALHGIIAKLMQGAAALRAQPADLAAIEPMRAALEEYGRSFDDPAFRAPAR